MTRWRAAAITEWARRSPVGILVISGVLMLAGLGFIFGSAHLALTRRVGWVPVAAGLVMGPLTVYAAVHLVRGSRWAWQTVVLLLFLLLGSSAWRLFAAPGLETVPIAEVVLEIVGLLYLTRAPVRRAFARA